MDWTVLHLYPQVNFVTMTASPYFLSTKFFLLKDSKLSLKGHWNKSNGLWYIPISIPLRHRSHTIVTRDITNTDLIQYLHACCFIPTPITFLKLIIHGNFLTWRGLNNQLFLKHILPSIATALGHLDQERKNLQLTKQVKSELEIEEDKNLYPNIDTGNTHELFAIIIPLNANRKGFRYITGSLPHKSIQGNFYVMVMYDYGSNGTLS